MPHQLLSAWAQFRPGIGPQILDGDDLLREPRIARSYTVEHPSWGSLVKRSDFGTPDQRLETALIPQPFFGNIDRAPVVILTLNPGLRPVDYFAEYHVDSYRRALIANLRLGHKHKPFPNLFLNPTFSWHSGFTYWHGRLAGLIDEFTERCKLLRIEAVSHFSKSIAWLELVPYHSASFGLPPSVVRQLRSVQLARAFVRDVLLPRARRSEAVIVVVRHAREWELCSTRGVVVYEGAETRGAYLTPSSRGGKAILSQMFHAWSRKQAS